MRERRSSKLLVEPPESAMGDIAFNLIVFFLVCASVQPDSGRKQSIPKSEENEEQQQADNIEVLLTRQTVALNGNPVAMNMFPAAIKAAIDSKIRPEDKIVVVKSKPETTYQHWITVTAIIEEAGGTITVQREEERQVVVD